MAKKIISLALGLVFFILPTLVGGVGSEKFKKEEELVRISMLQMSRELGVTCTECHSTSNFKDSSKPQFKMALQHTKIVEVLKREGMDGKLQPEASCFMCHQGKLKFVHKMNHPEDKN